MPNCGYCNKDVSPDATRCPNCGSDFSKNPPKESPFVAILGFAFIALIILLAALADSAGY